MNLKFFTSTPGVQIASGTRVAVDFGSLYTHGHDMDCPGLKGPPGVSKAPLGKELWLLLLKASAWEFWMSG